MHRGRTGADIVNFPCSVTFHSAMPSLRDPSKLVQLAPCIYDFDDHLDNIHHDWLNNPQANKELKAIFP
jgi:hypothetical protein